MSGQGSGPDLNNISDIPNVPAEPEQSDISRKSAVPPQSGGAGQNDDLVFYYNRQKRLERMPQSKKLYEGGFMPKRGFFAVLTGTKSNRFLLMALGFLAVLVIFLTLQGTGENRASIDGIPVELEAFVFDASVYATVTFSPSENGTGAEISVRIGVFNAEKQLIKFSDFTEIYEGEKKQLRAVFDAQDAAQAVAIVSLDEKTEILTITVDRK